MTDEAEPAPAAVGAPTLAELGALARFGTGATYPFRGLGFLARRPHLWGWIAVPVTLLVGMLVTAAWLVLRYVPLVLGAVVAPPANAGLAFFWWLAAVLLMLVLFAAAAVVLWAVSSLLATPFYDALAERVEHEVLGESAPYASWSVVLGDAARSIAHTLLALALYVALSAVVFAIGFVPAVGAVLSPVLGAIVTATFVARELLDVPLARRRLGFGAKLAYLRRHLALFEGLGFTAMLLLWVPLLNFVSMPIAVVGGTLLYCRLVAEGEGVPPPTVPTSAN